MKVRGAPDARATRPRSLRKRKSLRCAVGQAVANAYQDLRCEICESRFEDARGTIRCKHEGGHETSELGPQVSVTSLGEIGAPDGPFIAAHRSLVKNVRRGVEEPESRGGGGGRHATQRAR